MFELGENILDWIEVGRVRRQVDHLGTDFLDGRPAPPVLNALNSECLAKDRDELLAFYDFPAEHWKHLRTTNPIESVFATVRLRHRRTKGSGSRNACLAIVHQLMQSAAKRWRLLNGTELLPDACRDFAVQLNTVTLFFRSFCGHYIAFLWVCVPIPRAQQQSTPPPN